VRVPVSSDCRSWSTGGRHRIKSSLITSCRGLACAYGPVSSTTIATIVAAIATYLGNRYWSFRTRQRTGVVRELIIFAVLNGIGLLIQDATVAFNYYLLDLGHDKLAAFTALNLGIALATLFRFWSYRKFVWVAAPEEAGPAEGPAMASGPPAAGRG